MYVFRAFLKRIRLDFAEKYKMVSMVSSRTGRCLQRYDRKGYRQVVGYVNLRLIFLESVGNFSLQSSFEKFTQLGICQID
jgi:Ni2+-binding GTPase involved in maturation of urease and hydrogenase